MMKYLFKLLICVSCCIGTASAAVYTGKLKVLRGPDSRPCLLVTMVDVTSVDGGGPWFALEFTRTTEISMFLAAKMANKTVKLHTTSGSGVTECSNLPRVSLIEIM